MKKNEGSRAPKASVGNGKLPKIPSQSGRVAACLLGQLSFVRFWTAVFLLRVITYGSSVKPGAWWCVVVEVNASWDSKRDVSGASLPCHLLPSFPPWASAQPYSQDGMADLVPRHE
eukprot:1157003-Pelagomonas_calceolata.AAC.2